MAWMRTSRDVPPCKGCPDREYACSDHCQKPEYIKWRDLMDTIRHNRSKDMILNGYQADQIRRNRRVK